MKNNSYKYIFAAVIAILVLVSVIKINIDKNKINPNATQDTTSEVLQNNKTSEINLAIAQLDNINPIISKNKNVQDISKLIYEPLVNITQDYKTEAGLATEWAKIDENNYILKLRENVKWSNGEKFTSNDVKFTIDRLKEIDSLYSYNVQHVTGIEITDDYTIKILLDGNVPFFEYNLTFPILNAKYYEGQNFLNTEKNNTCIGTGMYKIANIEDGKIILEQNPNWWNLKNNKLSIQKININLYSSIGEVYNSFKMGNIDFLGITNMDYKQYIGTIGYNSKEYTAREHNYIAINTKNETLTQAEVRKSISLCIDKDNIISGVYANKTVKSNFPLDYGNWLLNGLDATTEYNPEYVPQLLQESGWAFKNTNWQKKINNKNLKLSFNLVVKASDEQKVNMANIIKTQLDNQGIRINIINASDQQYKNYLNNKNYDMIICSTTLSPSPNLNTFFGDNNYANYYTDEISAIIQEVNNTNDNEVLKEKYKRLLEIYKSEVPYISLYTTKNAVVYNTSLAGEINSNWFNLFYNINTWYK